MRAEEFIQEAPLPGDWEQDQMQVRKGTTFRSRIDYARQMAPRLGSGSSRVAFIIDYQGRPTVLKVAKNRKGLAQNLEEVSILKDGYLGRLPIVIPLIDFDGESGQDVSWLHTEMAQQVRNEAQLEQWFGGNLAQLIEYSKTIIGKWRPSRYKTLREHQAAIIASIENKGGSEEQLNRFTETAEYIADLVNNSSIDAIDFTWYKNWGWYQGRPVIIDLGYAGSAIPLYRM